MMGLIGIKVWICKGEVLGKRELNPNFAGGKSDLSDRRERRDDDRRSNNDRRGGDRRPGSDRDRPRRDRR